MCVVCNIADDFIDRWTPPPVYPDEPKKIYPGPEKRGPTYIPVVPPNMPTQDEIDEFRRLLEKARQQDIEEGNPDCGSAEKKRILKEIADQFGIDISFVDEIIPDDV